MSQMTFSFKSLNVLSLRPDPAQPRKKHNRQANLELEESMRTHGMLQTILAREEGGEYIIVNGERRWSCATNLGWETVDCLVTTADSQHALVLQLIENVQREDLSPDDMARHLLALKSQYDGEDRKSTMRVLAALVGKSVGWVSEKLALATIPAELQALKENQTVKNSRVLIGLSRLSTKNPEAASVLIKEIEAGKRVTPELISQVGGTQRLKRAPIKERVVLSDLPDSIISPPVYLDTSGDGETSGATDASRPAETPSKPKRKKKVAEVARLIGVSGDLPAEELLEKLADAYTRLLAARETAPA